MASHHAAPAPSGLCWIPAGSICFQRLPLQNVRVDATLYDLCSEVKMQQTYVNDQHDQLECIYIFPLDEDSAVFSFEAELDGVSVKGHIREKSEARAEYKTALDSNRAAMLLEQSSDNTFQCKVGNLKHGSVCTVTFTYLTVLEQEGRHNRLTLPMIIAPQNKIHKGYHCHHCLCSPIIGTRHHCAECSNDLCHGCYLQHDIGHPIHTGYSMGRTPRSSKPQAMTACIPTHTTIQSKVKDLIIKLNITMPSPILSIQCPSHPDETKITQSHNTSNHATVFFHSESACSLSKDFILLIEQQHCFEPRVLCELDLANHTAAVSLAFIPPPIDMPSASQIQCELVFLIDCSGSMSCVRECMQLLLRSLPVHSHFNIITFGSAWSSLFSSSQPYDDTSLSAASHHISKLVENMGAKEIYPPLLHVLTSEALPTHPRQVFLLTDGQVSNVQQLVQLTTQHAHNTRLFTFGIGNSVDRLLCKKLARAGRGKCEFVTAEDGGGSGMREKVVRQVARAMQPVLTEVIVDWGQLKETFRTGNNEKHLSTDMQKLGSSVSNARFMQCPSVAPAIFISSRYMLHALNVSLPDSVWQQAKESRKVDFNCEICITARSNQPLEKEQMHQMVMLTGEQINLARVIHTLAAKERVRELEDNVCIPWPIWMCNQTEKLEDEILHLTTKYSLSSNRTSFVVVYNTGTAVDEIALSFRADLQDDANWR